MKTALVTTSYLEGQDRYDRAVKFVNYYKDEVKVDWDMYVLDNHSSMEVYTKFLNEVKDKTKLVRFPEHFGRPSHLDYKYLWRAVFHLQNILMSYDKVVYMDNDFYILKQSMIDYVNALDNGWTTFWCGTYGFPETGCHVVTKDCKEYQDFVACGMEQFFEKYNGKLMEHELPVTHIERKFVGDRYGERNQPQKSEMDYYAQAHNPKIKLRFGV